MDSVLCLVAGGPLLDLHAHTDHSISAEILVSLVSENGHDECAHSHGTLSLCDGLRGQQVHRALHDTTHSNTNLCKNRLFASPSSSSSGK